MRISTPMMNRMNTRTNTASYRRNAGALSYLNRTNSRNDILNRALQSQTGSAVMPNKYERQDKAADALTDQIKKFTSQDGKNAFDRSRESEDGTILCKEAEALVKDYNNLISELGSGPDYLDTYYRQSLMDRVNANKDLLAEVGITASKDGRLQIDSYKMKNASFDTMEKVFGENSEFMTKVNDIAGRVSNRAEDNIKSAYESYARYGALGGAYGSTGYSYGNLFSGYENLLYGYGSKYSSFGSYGLADYLTQGRYNFWG